MKIFEALILLALLIGICFIVGFLIIYIPYKRAKRGIKQYGFKEPSRYVPKSSVDDLDESIASTLDGKKALDDFHI